MQETETATTPADQHLLDRADHHPNRLETAAVAAFTVWFFATALHAIRSLPLWYDEFFTLALARMSIGGIWNTLQHGLEPNPPIGYLLSALAYHCSGGQDWAIRLPGILALWTASFLMYRIVRPYSHAIVAVSILFLTPVLFGTLNFLDARPYPLLLLCAVLVVRFWIACDQQGLMARLGLAGSLSAALWTHFASTALIASLVLVEIVWCWRAERVRYRVWVTLVLATCTLLPLVPQIHSFSMMFHGWLTGARVFSAAPSLRTVGHVYIELYLLLLPFTAICALLRPHGFKSRQAYGQILPVTMLVATPIIGYIIVTVSSGAFVSRYCVTAIPGILILYSLIPGQVKSPPNWAPKLLTTLTLPLYCVLISLTLFRLPGSQVGEYLKQIEVSENRNLPVVIADAGIFPAVVYYASAELKPRLLYLGSAAEAKKLPFFVHEMSFPVLKQWYTLPTEDFRSFLNRKQPFLMLVHQDREREWLPAKLREIDAIRLHMVNKKGNIVVFHCSFDQDTQ